MGKAEANKIINQLKTYQDRATSTRQSAVEALQRAGLVTKSGRAAQPYQSAAPRVVKR